MTKMERNEFLQFVYEYIKTDPEASAFLQQAVAEALRDNLNKAYERATDMEVALAVMSEKRLRKGALELVIDKLRKWKDKTSLRWDWLTDQYPEKPKTEEDEEDE